ncbi:hypothetical protein BJX96DRAFT_168823 [Aspergillus floccosus]
MMLAYAILLMISALQGHTISVNLENPCIPADGLDTGFSQFNPNDKDDLTLTITVNTLDPQWFFCKQNQPFSHCHAGMIFALNPGDRMDAFLENAKNHARENSLTPLPESSAVSTPVLSPAESSSPVIVQPVSIVTVTHSVGCTASASAMSIRRSDSVASGVRSVTVVSISTMAVICLSVLLLL